MTKQEYIQIVHSQLSGVDPRDLSDAIVYLNEYFEEAGVENEQKVIEELGSPEKYAATIRADLVASVLLGSLVKCKRVLLLKIVYGKRWGSWCLGFVLCRSLYRS